MTTSDRPHRRARRQLCLGLVPLLVAGLAVLLLVLAQLSSARAPLAAATGVAVARVVEPGQPPGGRGVLVEFDDAGRVRTGVLVLAEPVEVQRGAEVAVRYVPGGAGTSTPVFTDGDARSRLVLGRVSDAAAVTGLMVLAAGATALVALAPGRLRRRPAGTVPATRLVVRRGLLVRSWLELDTAHGTRWLPVFWSRELAGLAPGSAIDVHGDLAGGRRALPVVGGVELWPSGRLRDRAPRGEQRMPTPGGATGTGLARQVRADAPVLLAAPLLGLLWAYVAGSGPGGAAAASVLSGAGLFWLFQLLGSDPQAPARD